MDKIYTRDHFWLEKVKKDSPLRGAILPPLEQEDLYIFGATQHGIDALGDVVAVDVYQGNYKSMETFGTIESRKAVVDLTVPVPCTLIRVNHLMGREDAKYLQSLNENPEQVWIAILEISDQTLMEKCMTEEAYKKFICN